MSFGGWEAYDPLDVAWRRGCNKGRERKGRVDGGGKGKLRAEVFSRGYDRQYGDTTDIER